MSFSFSNLIIYQNKESIQKNRQLDSDIDGAGLGMDTPALDIDVFANETCGSARYQFIFLI